MTQNKNFFQDSRFDLNLSQKGGGFSAITPYLSNFRNLTKRHFSIFLRAEKNSDQRKPDLSKNYVTKKNGDHDANY
jgi:hypothetical protein